MLIKDQMNRILEFKSTPLRIVSLVPSLTELIVDLGLEAQLVGVTKFCVHPQHIRKSKAIVGGTKSVKFDKISALSPDIILCNKEENTLQMIKELEKLATVHISDIKDVEDTLEVIRAYAKIFSVGARAETLVQNIISEKERFSNRRASHVNKKKVAYFIWKNPYMVAGNNTFINSMLIEAGFENAFSEIDRYPEVDIEDEILRYADCIFLSSEPYTFKDEDVYSFKAKFASKEVKIVDGEMFSWYGSRLLKAFKYFETLHD